MWRENGAACFNVATLSPNGGNWTKGAETAGGLCCLRSYFPSLLHPRSLFLSLCLSLSDHWHTHLKTASHRVRPITSVKWAVKQRGGWKAVKGNSAFQPGSSWSRAAPSIHGKSFPVWPKKRFAVVLKLRVFTATVSERNVQSLVPEPRGPHTSVLCYILL